MSNNQNNIISNNNLNLEMALINNLIDNLKYEDAKTLLLEKIQKYPNDVDILDTLSEVLISLDEPKEAIKVLKKSIELEPEKNPEKYMSLGQLSNYKNSLKLYKKGVELYCIEINTLDQNDPEYLNNLKKLKMNLASAYASIAELYMNTDLCHEPDAESVCEQTLNEALNQYPESIDALLQLSNLRILRARDEEALQYMNKIFDFTINILDSNIVLNNEQPPSSDMITNLAKNYSELKSYDKAIKLYDILIRLNDEDLEIWYLLAFNHYQIANHKASLKCLENLKKISDKTGEKNPEIEEAANELFSELMKIKNSKGNLTDSTLVSEEELSEKYEIQEEMKID